MELKTRSGRRASQRADELLPFIDLLKAKNVRSYLEIGARHGDTFFDVMMSMPVGSKGVAVDLPGGPWGQMGTNHFLDAACRDLREKGYDISVIYGDSGASWVFEKVSARRPFDAIFIDGDHSIDGVSRDWHMYGPLAPIVSFHDIAGENVRQATTGDPVEVHILWEDLRARRETIEFVGAQRGYGIGVVLQ